MGKDGEVRSSLKKRKESCPSPSSNEEYKIIIMERGCNTPDTGHQNGLGSRLYNHRGIIFVIFGVFIYASGTILYRLAQNEVHSMEAVFIIFVCQGFVTVPPIAYNGSSPVAKSRKIMILLILRGSMGVSGCHLMYLALQDLRAGDATVIVRSAPVLVGIFARIFLKEAFGFIDVTLTAIVVAGVVLIAQPPFLFSRLVEEDTQSRVVGCAYAFGACVSYALSYVINRQLGILSVDSFVNVLYYSVTGAVVSTILNSVFGVWSIPSCGTVRFALVGIGTTACVAQCLITYSYSLEKSFVVSLLQTNEVIFAYLLEFLFFSVTPDLISVAGVVAIVSASATASVRKSEWVSPCRGKSKSRQEEVAKGPVLNKSGEQKETLV